MKSTCGWRKAAPARDSCSRWIVSWKKGAAVVLRAAVVRRGIQGDEARQVFILRAETVKRPRAERGPHELEAAGVHLGKGLCVVRQIGMHRVDDAQVVRVFCELRIQRRHPLPGLSKLREGMHWPEQPRAHRIAAQGRRLTAACDQLRLVVEKVHMRRPAAHGEEDDALRPCREMCSVRREAALRHGLLGQRGERQPADAGGHLGQKIAAGEEGSVHLTRRFTARGARRWW